MDSGKAMGRPLATMENPDPAWEIIPPVEAPPVEIVTRPPGSRDRGSGPLTGASLWLRVIRMPEVNQLAVSFDVFDGCPSPDAVRRFVDLNRESLHLGASAVVMVDSGIRFVDRRHAGRWVEENSMLVPGTSTREIRVNVLMGFGIEEPPNP